MNMKQIIPAALLTTALAALTINVATAESFESLASLAQLNLSTIIAASIVFMPISMLLLCLRFKPFVMLRK